MGQGQAESLLIGCATTCIHPSCTSKKVLLCGLITLQKVARRLGIRPGTLYRWKCAKVKLTFYKVINVVKCDPDEIDRIIAKSRIAPISTMVAETGRIILGAGVSAERMPPAHSSYLSILDTPPQSFLLTSPIPACDSFSRSGRDHRGPPRYAFVPRTHRGGLFVCIQLPSAPTQQCSPRGLDGLHFVSQQHGYHSRATRRRSPRHRRRPLLPRTNRHPERARLGLRRSAALHDWGRCRVRLPLALPP